MKFTLGLAQCNHPADGDVLGMVERYAASAKEQGVDLLVFPEYLMTPYETPQNQFAQAAQDLDGEFCRNVGEIAKSHGLWMVYTMNQRNSSYEWNPDALKWAQGRQGTEDLLPKPCNTAVVCDSAGVIRGSYQKTHLFGNGQVSESDRLRAGSELFAPLDTPFGRLSLAICYDLRFPEVARFAALRGTQLLLYPSAWVAGPGKAAQWKTLLAARAIENQLFVAGVSRGDNPAAGSTGYVGQSCVFGPDGACLAAAAGREPELVVVSLDTQALDQARAAMLVLEQRRPELYQEQR